MTTETRVDLGRRRLLGALPATLLCGGFLSLPGCKDGPTKPEKKWADVELLSDEFDQLAGTLVASLGVFQEYVANRKAFSTAVHQTTPGAEPLLLDVAPSDLFGYVHPRVVRRDINQEAHLGVYWPSGAILPQLALLGPDGKPISVRVAKPTTEHEDMGLVALALPIFDRLPKPGELQASDFVKRIIVLAGALLALWLGAKVALAIASAVGAIISTLFLAGVVIAGIAFLPDALRWLLQQLNIGEDQDAAWLWEQFTTLATNSLRWLRDQVEQLTRQYGVMEEPEWFGLLPRALGLSVMLAVGCLLFLLSRRASEAASGL